MQSCWERHTTKLRRDMGVASTKCWITCRAHTRSPSPGETSYLNGLLTIKQGSWTLRWSLRSELNQQVGYCAGLWNLDFSGWNSNPFLHHTINHSLHSMVFNPICIGQGRCHYSCHIECSSRSYMEWGFLHWPWERNLYKISFQFKGVELMSLHVHVWGKILRMCAVQGNEPRGMCCFSHTVCEGLNSVTAQAHQKNSLQEMEVCTQWNSILWPCCLEQRSWDIVWRELKLWVVTFAKRPWIPFLVLPMRRVIMWLLLNMLSSSGTLMRCICFTNLFDTVRKMIYVWLSAPSWRFHDVMIGSPRS